MEFGLGEGGDVSGSVDDDRLAEALDRLDCSLAVHLPYQQVVTTPVPELNDAIVAYQERLLDWAAGHGAHTAVLHATVRDPHDMALREMAADQFERIVAAGRKRGLEVVLENVGHQRRGLQLSVLGELAECVDAPVCFDVGHAHMEDGDDGIERFLREHADRVAHLHVHDARSRGDTHIPVGAGEIDYGVVGDRLGGFDGTVAVEVFTDDVALLRDSADRVAASLGVER